MKTQRKCSLANGELRLVFKDEETDSFLPNVVCLPMIDFNITVLLRQMHSGKAAVSINQYFKVSDKNPAGELCMKSK